MKKSFYYILTDTSLTNLETEVQHRLNTGWQLGGFATAPVKRNSRFMGGGEYDTIAFYQVVYKVFEE